MYVHFDTNVCTSTKVMVVLFSAGCAAKGRNYLKCQTRKKH